METRSIPKQDWQNALDRIYRAEKARPQRITIEVDSQELGAQKEVENVPFQGIGYDHKDDLVAVDTDDIEHLINHPQKIEMAFSGGDLICIEVMDRDKVRHLIYFMPPLPLPAAAKA